MMNKFRNYLTSYNDESPSALLLLHMALKKKERKKNWTIIPEKAIHYNENITVVGPLLIFYQRRVPAIKVILSSLSIQLLRLY